MNRFKLIVAALLTIGVLWLSSDSQGQLTPEKYGIGAVLTRADSLSPITIKSCISGGPAERGGLLPGDQIMALDAYSIEGWSFTKVVDYLLLEKPTILMITVRRDSSQVSFELLRAKYSDILAGVQMKMAHSADSLGWQMVPLDEQPPLKIGSVLGPIILQDVRCTDAELHLDGPEPSILYFWASWCGPCKLLMKELAASREQIDGSDIRLIGINVDNSCETFIAAKESLRPAGEQYWSGGYYSPLSQVLRVHRLGIPTAAFLDQNGQLVKVSTGVYNVMELFKSAAIERQ